MSRPKKQFCLNGHDTFIYGRFKNNGCRECDRIRCSEYRLLHKSEAKVAQAKWKQENREEYNSYQNNLYHTDINHKLASRLRNRINDVLKGKVKVSSVMDALGCDLDFLRKHIESLWLPGMNWDNWSKFGWHIDHKDPLDSFDLTDPIQFAKAVHYTNLQPMWAPDNWSKSNKIL